MSRIADYSAVAAKARAMQAKRLSAESWERLEQMDSVYRLSELLHQSSGWSSVPQTDNADILCEALNAQAEENYRHLRCYLRRDRDREYLAFFLRRKSHALSYANEDYLRAAECIDKSYRGLSRLALKKLLGTEADMLNLVYILRLRRFPQSLPEAKKRLIPLRVNLTDSTVDALLHAKDDETVAAILRQSGWKNAFGDLSPAALDGQYESYMETLCKKLVTGAGASLAVPVAYMMLLTIDRQKLTRRIRSVATTPEDKEGR